MKNGDLFTTNGRKGPCQDRSYTGHIWRVVEEDESHVWAIAEFGDFWSRGNTGGGKPVPFLKRDFDLLPCSETTLSNLIEEQKRALKAHHDGEAA